MRKSMRQKIGGIHVHNHESIAAHTEAEHKLTETGGFQAYTAISNILFSFFIRRTSNAPLQASEVERKSYVQS